MPTESNGVMRFDVNNVNDLAVLVRSGLIWRGGPQAIAAAVTYLKANPGAVNDMVPANIRAMLQPAPEQESTAEDATEPVEEPSVTPSEPPVA